MNENDGKKFEKEVEDVFKTISALEGVSVIEKDARLDSPEGPRQIDLLIKTHVAGHELLTIVECKDKLRRVDLPTVDAFHSLLDDVRANKGILVSRSGFSKNAIQKARRLGIDLCTIDKLSNNLSNPLASLPIIVKFFAIENLSLNYTFQEYQSHKRIRASLDRYLCGMGVKELLSFLPFNEIFYNSKVTKEITKEEVGQPIWIDGADGDIIPISKCDLSMNVSPEVFFGFASDLPSTFIKETLGENIMDLIFENDELHASQNYFIKYEKIDALPQNIKDFHIQVLSIPGSYKSASFSISAFDPNIGQVVNFGKGTLTSNT